MITFGQPHRHLAQCGSTNDAARAWMVDADAPAPSGALVTAEFQTAGRGQRGRIWAAGWGQSALMSFVYRLEPGADRGVLGLLVGLAAVEAVASLTGRQTHLKWPNDVLLEGRKVAGALVEVAGSGAVLGIGLNVGQTGFVGSERYAYPPTSLRLATGGEVQDVSAAVAAVSQSLSVWEARRQTDGFPSILENCRRRLATGVTVRRGEQQGQLMGLSEAGAAWVRLENGTFAEWTTVEESTHVQIAPSNSV